MSEIPLRITGLEKSYHQGDEVITVLNDLNISLEKNQTCAILGQSGSGKSTLLTLLAGLDSPDLGEIFIGGIALSGLSQKELTDFRSRYIGIVFQQYHLIEGLTALENVMLPLEIKKDVDAKSKAKKLLERVGLGHRLSHLPTQLSGGECQRVAIARALCVSPQLLLADEPSGSLDPKTGSSVMDLLFEIVDELDTTLVLVTHDEALAKRCSRTFHLQNGRLIEGSL
jgi:putative ABC transport system ATP-binding protein